MKAINVRSDKLIDNNPEAEIRNLRSVFNSIAYSDHMDAVPRMLLTLQKSLADKLERLDLSDAAPRQVISTMDLSISNALAFIEKEAARVNGLYDAVQAIKILKENSDSYLSEVERDMGTDGSEYDMDILKRFTLIMPMELMADLYIAGRDESNFHIWISDVLYLMNSILDEKKNLMDAKYALSMYVISLDASINALGRYAEYSNDLSEATAVVQPLLGALANIIINMNSSHVNAEDSKHILLAMSNVLGGIVHAIKDESTFVFDKEKPTLQ